MELDIVVEVGLMISTFEGFIKDEYLSELEQKKTRGVNHLVVDFKKLIMYSPDLAQYFLDEPEEALKACSIACTNIDNDLPKDFNIRIKNVTNNIKIQINQIRAKHIDKIITVEGMIKQKSDVKGQIQGTRFECPSCGNVINVLQIDERKFREPTKCGCGRKGKFRLLSKKVMDVFSVLLEETTEFAYSGSKLSTIKVLCASDLTNPEVERAMYQGCKVEITGVLKEIMILHQGKQTSKVDWYLDANYIRIYNESFFNIKWNKQDLKDFQNLASNPHWLQELRKSIFYNIHGFEEECEGVILQMFGGVGVVREGAQVKGTMHILLVGDPGTSKSTILKIADKFHPKSQYTAGKGVSGVGLTCTVVKDELLGGYTAEAGLLVLNNDGVVMLDELDKLSETDRDALHEPMSDETVSTAKANQHITMTARTSILAAANPREGSYSQYQSVYSQIDLKPTLINRFDLIYPILDSKLNPKDHYNISQKMLDRRYINEQEVSDYSKEFIKKYIAYAKTINPVMPKDIREYISKRYQDLQEKRRNNTFNGADSAPFTARNLDSLRRIIEAIARSRLSDTISMDDAQLGFSKLLYSLKQIGIDPETGDTVEEIVTSGGKLVTIKKKDLFSLILKLVKERNNNGELMDAVELIGILESEGHNSEVIEEALSKLQMRGDLIEPKRGRYSAAV